MTIHRYLVPLLATLLTTVGAAESPAEYSFRGLGTVGGDYSVAYALSANGSVVVGSSRNADGDGRAFRWEDGAMAAIGEATHWVAPAVSADGSVVIVEAYGSDVFRWEHGVLVQLPTPLGASSCTARDISPDGSVVVGESEFLWLPPDPSYTYAVVWGPPDEKGEYGIRSLRQLGGYQSFPYGLSADASVIVGMSENRARDFQAVRWEGSQILALGTLGGLRSAAYDVSADGSVVVGWAQRPGGLREAFRWEDGSMLGLGTLPGDWEESVAKAVSADGCLVVGYAHKSQPEGPSIYDPFLWDEAHGMRSLSALLSQKGIDLSDWDLDGAQYISADGRVIVGTGYHISAARTEGWIATVPEPSTLTGLFTMGAVLLLAQLWRRRRRVD